MMRNTYIFHACIAALYCNDQKPRNLTCTRFCCPQVSRTCQIQRVWVINQAKLSTFYARAICNLASYFLAVHRRVRLSYLVKKYTKLKLKGATSRATLREYLGFLTVSLVHTRSGFSGLSAFFGQVPNVCQPYVEIAE